MFNWFRRKQGAQQQSSETAEESSSTPNAEISHEDANDGSTPTESAAPAKSTDYLSWAKTAFQNLQRQQTAPPESSLESVKSVPSSVTDKRDTLDGPNTVTESDVASAATLLDEAEASHETTKETKTFEATEAITVPTPMIEEDTPGSTTIPSSDPQRDINAIAIEPTPQSIAESKASAESALHLATTNTPAASSDPTITQHLAFDEGFIWSAQVLAEQGRQPEDVAAEEISWLQQLRQGLGKTRRGVVNQLKAVVGQGPLDQAAVDDIEALLLQADVGIEATDYIIETLQARLRQETLPPEEAIAYLKQLLRDVLDRPLQDRKQRSFAPEKNTLNIWLLTGVNGAGKTTTIGKLAHLAQKSGYRCLIAAADTFRAAAVEQVKVWGDRSGTPVIANPGKNTDPAAIVFDGIAAAESRHTELLLVDTAGRLQNKKNLMDELSKIRRIIDKKAAHAKVESLLVLDATLGQNGLRQAEVFAQSAKLSGVVLTKLDGSAKGGVALAVAQQLNLPIRFIGAGEGIEDLRPFSSYEFVEALLAN